MHRYARRNLEARFAGECARDLYATPELMQRFPADDYDGVPGARRPWCEPGAVHQP